MKLKVGDIVEYKGKNHKILRIDETEKLLILEFVYTHWVPEEHVSQPKEHKYKPGDIVRVKDDLIRGYWYGEIPWLHQTQYAGEIDEIDAIDDDGVVVLKKCKGLFSTMMLELIDSSTFKYRYVDVEDMNERDN